DYSGSTPAARVYTGNGAGTWTSRAGSMPQDTSQSFGVDVGDVDKDGDMDIVYARGSGLRCYLGNSGGVGGGSFTWTAANTGLATSGRHSQLNLTDLDNDGDLDIVVAVVNGGVVAYLGNGGGGTGQSWSKLSKKLPTSGQYYGAAAGDFNKDGITDIAGCMWEDGTSAGGLYAWKGGFVNNYDPTAKAVWKDTTVNETNSWLADSVELDGTGSSDPQDAPTGDDDGDKLTYDWNFTAVPSGSSMTDASLSPGDNNATPSFTPDKTGDYRLSLRVQDSAGNWSGEVYVKLEVRKPNLAPVADAGEDQTVNPGALVELNSSGSTDADGVIMAWQWNESVGNPESIALNGATLPVASFTAPSTLGTYEFMLRVRDDNLTWSATDYINITVELPPNQPPIAVAPNDFVTRVDEVTYLNASSSYDQDGGTIVAWDWNCTSHPSLTIVNDDAEEASFTAVLPGSYVFTLVVQDDRGDWSAEDSVTVTVQEADVNVPPVAEIAGPAVIDKYVGDDVVLDGSNSRDDDGTIEQYLWNCTSHPGLNFTGQNTTTVTFRPTETGDFVFTLAVLDDNGSWSVNEDTVTVRVTTPPVNTPPEPVIAGPSVKVRPGDQVTLDGSQSNDRDGTIVQFEWRCISHPSLNFTGQNTTYIRFTATEVGDYTFTLDVLDNMGAWADDPAYWTVSVKTNVAPVANITGPDYGLPGVNITFSAAASTDEDGEVVAWSWDCTSHEELEINGSENETMFIMAMYADVYVIVLTVMDDEDAWSAVAEHEINITHIDQHPVADAGGDKQVRMGASVELNGGGSYDVEGDIVTWRWKCTSHPTVPGLVNTDQMVASFTPPEPGTFVFTLEVEDGAGQWSEPDEVYVTVLETNSAPEVTVISPEEGDVFELDDLNPYLVVRWDTYDANGDTLRFKVEIYMEGTLFLARKSNLPHGTDNVTFDDTSFNFPRDKDLVAKIFAWETNTEDRYETIETAGPFRIKDPISKPNGGGDDDDTGGISLNWMIIAVVVILGIAFAAFALSRGGGEDEEDVPWEDEPPARGGASPPTKSALAPKAPVTATAAVQAEKARAAKEAAKQAGKKTDPHGRVLDCPDCGAPLDHDTDFGAPYCWDCDKYF
ncbi:MAG: VCBS repeat-containing protein, partial [Thermoplasmata archaeon]